MSSRNARRVAILDCGMGNLFSVAQACEHVGLEGMITSEAGELKQAAGVILPGVGAFADAMGTLERLKLIEPIHDFIASGKPFMGICLGMQLLFDKSEEFGLYQGLGVIPGVVVRFPAKNKVPEVGWNTIRPPRNKNAQYWDDTALGNILPGEFMYFVHSYYCQPVNPDIVLSVTEYADVEYCSSIVWKNIYASQFHPEKSAHQGLRVYSNWAKKLRR